MIQAVVVKSKNPLHEYDCFLRFIKMFREGYCIHSVKDERCVNEHYDFPDRNFRLFYNRRFIDGHGSETTITLCGNEEGCNQILELINRLDDVLVRNLEGAVRKILYRL